MATRLSYEDPWLSVPAFRRVWLCRIILGIYLQRNGPCCQAKNVVKNQCVIEVTVIIEKNEKVQNEIFFLKLILFFST